MRNNIWLEFRKMRRLHTLPLLIGLIAAVAALSSASLFSGRTHEMFDNPAAHPWASLLLSYTMMAAMTSPILVAVLASRQTDIEHSGVGWTLAATAGHPGNIVPRQARCPCNLAPTRRPRRDASSDWHRPASRHPGTVGGCAMGRLHSAALPCGRRLLCLTHLACRSDGKPTRQCRRWNARGVLGRVLSTHTRRHHQGNPMGLLRRDLSCWPT